MGLFDFLRRKDERAIPKPGTAEFDTAVAGSTLPGAEGVEMGTPGWASVDSAPDVGRESAAAGGASPQEVKKLTETFYGLGNQDAPQTLDLRGVAGVREEILEVMRRHGLDPDPASPQQIDAGSVPALQREIGEILARHGLTVWGLNSGPGSGGDRG